MTECNNLIDYLGGGFFFIAMLLILAGTYTVAYYSGRKDGRSEIIQIQRAARARIEYDEATKRHEAKILGDR